MAMIPCPARLLVALTCALFAAQVPMHALTLYVAPDGKDAWSGRLDHPNAAGDDGPVASLTGARDAVRKLRENGELEREPITVQIASGDYPVIEPLVLEP